jgi:hypothetical protein
MRELKRYKSCDGLEFATMAEAAKHECETAIPAKLRQRLFKLYAAEFGAPDVATQFTLANVVNALTVDRRNARLIRDVLDEYSKASMYLPLEPAHA